jgi:hypothetical protein
MVIRRTIDERLRYCSRDSFTTKRETVNQALHNFINHYRQLEMLELEGQIDSGCTH